MITPSEKAAFDRGFVAGQAESESMIRNLKEQLIKALAERPVTYTALDAVARQGSHASSARRIR